MPSMNIGKVRVFVNDQEITDFVCGVSVDLGEDPQVSIWTRDAAAVSSEILRTIFEIKFQGIWVGVDPSQGEKQ